MVKQIPSEIKNYLAVDESSLSGLIWINTDHCKNNVVSVGDCAGHWDASTSPAYYKVIFKRKTYKAHRIIWYLMTGEDPKELEIDHIDKNTLNNNFSNLRLVERYKNMNNRSRWGQSNYRGVYLNKNDFTYSSYLIHKGKRVYLGKFITEEDAALAWDYAAINLYQVDKILNFPEANSANREQALKKRIKQRGILYNGKILRGVSYDKRRNKYQSYIRLNGKMIALGRYSTAVEAAKIRDIELRKRGITDVDFNFD